mgnify:FL=1
MRIKQIWLVFFLNVLFASTVFGNDKLIVKTVSQQEQLASFKIDASLISQNDGIEEGKEFWLALFFEMESSWHVYAKNPGDFGSPVQMQWQLPEFLEILDTVWPVPEQSFDGKWVGYTYGPNTLLLARVGFKEGYEVQGDSVHVGCKVS